MEGVVATAITSAIVPFFSVWAAIMMGVDLTRLRAMREAVRGRLCPLTMSVCHPGGGGSDYVRPRLEKVGLELMESICAQSSPPLCAQFIVNGDEVTAGSRLGMDIRLPSFERSESQRACGLLAALSNVP